MEEQGLAPADGIASVGRERWEEESEQKVQAAESVS